MRACSAEQKIRDVNLFILNTNKRKSVPVIMALRHAIITLFILSSVLSAPLSESEKEEDDFFADSDVLIPSTEKPEPKYTESYIQKIPRRGHIKPGEELEKCVKEDPEVGHPHLVKEDIEDVAEVLITHVKDKPEHEHKFIDLPLEVQTDVAADDVENITQSTTTKIVQEMVTKITESSSNSEINFPPTATIAPEDVPGITTDEVPISTTDKTIGKRKKRDNSTEDKKKRLTKISRPKLKNLATTVTANADKKPMREQEKPAPIPISLDEVAGFREIKKKS